MHVKVITNNNGSILGRIPVRMSEEPQPEANRVARNNANYRSPWPTDSDISPIALDDETRNRTLEALAEDNEQGEVAQPLQQQPSQAERPIETQEHDRTDHSPQQRGYWFRGSSIKSLVKGFLSLEIPEDSPDWGRNSVAEGQSFFPDPMITFLVDQPRDLLCQICQTTTLSIATSAHTPDEHTPGILPCGHMACHTCLWSWVIRNKTCPFCRKEMKHSGCGHTLKPALITHDTIARLPKTLSRGGTIGETCRECRDRENRGKTYILWGIATNAVRISRQAPPDADPRNASRAEEVARELFESVPQGYLKNLNLEKNAW
ncbi:uncharacterized protein F4812DRAFT_469078 [Daldinia caldariorum]|uniref:uncharacterized protein n=1 Tax=Daldinia caldariorum TaxID=326644 RepID=UPI002007F551|nr:uncharacterized protein F4812DRAFT_469078 [Daldinia caldariorum]KAI1470490.1 hypothetical protein F4812DRAFT_469078 [Daldinia caldariorum]